jgi:hypothetical protein
VKSEPLTRETVRTGILRRKIGSIDPRWNRSFELVCTVGRSDPESVASTTERVLTPPPSEIAPDESAVVPSAVQQLILPRLQSFLEFHSRNYLTHFQTGNFLPDSFLSADLRECTRLIESFIKPPVKIPVIQDIAVQGTPISEEGLLSLLETAVLYAAYLNGNRYRYRAQQRLLPQFQERVRQSLEKYQEPDRLQTKLGERLEKLRTVQAQTEAEMGLVRQAMADVHKARDWVRLNILKKVREDMEELLAWDLGELSAEEQVSAAWRVLDRSTESFEAWC